MWEIIFLIFAIVCSLLGLAGSVLPILPGMSFNFLAIVILYFLKSGLISVSALVFFGILTIMAVFSDYVFPVAGAKKIGYSRYGIWGLVAGMILGFMTFSFIGMMAGAIVGVVLGELSGGKSSEKAMHSGFAVIWGMTLSLIFKFLLSLIMTIYFFVKLASLIGH